MKAIKQFIRNNRILNMIPRFIGSTKKYNYRYFQIIKWLFNSREDTNYTYELTDGNWLTMAKTISLVTNKPYEEITNYINEIRQNKEFANYVTQKTKESEFASRADTTVFLHKRVGWYAFVRATKPRLVVETGVDKGLGSVTLCEALLKNREEGFPGQFYGTDINPKAGYLLGDKYLQTGAILYGDSIQSLTNLKGEIDIFINDSDHSETYEYNEYMVVLPKLSRQSIILGDNSHSTDSLLRFSVEQNRKFLFFQEYPLNHWYPGGGIGISFI